MGELMPWHQNWLTNIEYDRVDLVKEGANSQANIKLFKSKGEVEMELKDILAKMKPEHAATVQLVLKSKDEEIAKLKTSNEGPQGTSEEEILKTVKDPAVKALLETQIAKAKAAEAEVIKSREAKLETEAIAKAKDVPNLGAEEAKLTEVFKGLAKVDAQLAEDVYGIMKAASALVAEGGVFTEVGKTVTSPTGGEGATDEQTAWNAIEKAAEPIAKERGISQTNAIAQIVKERPDLYDAYIKAQRG